MMSVRLVTLGPMRSSCRGWNSIVTVRCAAFSSEPPQSGSGNRGTPKSGTPSERASSFRSGEHEFVSSRSRDVSSQVVAERDGGRAGGRVASTPQSAGSASVYDRAGVDLSGSTQGNMPQPFNNQGNRSPHFNQGGPVQQDGRYMSGKQQDVHIKRKFSVFTGSVMYQKTNLGHVVPEGIQGDDAVQFQAFIRNCEKYHFGDCDKKLEDVNKGRKTLSEVFAEQDVLIQKIVGEYQSRSLNQYSSAQTAGPTSVARPDDSSRQDGVAAPIQSLKGLKLDDLVQLEDPCIQGIQGDDCAGFKMWLENCSRYGLSTTEADLTALREGTKSLAQVFQEQDQLFQQIIKDYESGPSAATANQRA